MVETWNGLVPHSHVMDKNWEGYLGSRSLPEEPGVPVPHQVPHPRAPVLGREVPITSGCKNQRGLWLSEMEGNCIPSQFLTKGPHMDLLRLTPSELQHGGSSSKGMLDIWGRSKLSAMRVTARG